jgi:hypothetical protein
MNLFRSEEHIDRWLAGRAPGRTIPVTTLSDLAHAWWGDRLSPAWGPRSTGENQAILDSLGMTDPFWKLPGPYNNEQR